jgi:hypothetical protein
MLLKRLIKSSLFIDRQFINTVYKLILTGTIVGILIVFNAQSEL